MPIVQNWGNSLGIRIPKNILADMKISKGDKVKCCIKKGKIVISPDKKTEVSLKELLAKMNENNNHPETTWSCDTGKEVVDE